MSVVVDSSKALKQSSKTPLPAPHVQYRTYSAAEVEEIKIKDECNTEHYARLVGGKNLLVPKSKVAEIDQLHRNLVTEHTAELAD